jgi:hypothetical protein
LKESSTVNFQHSPYLEMTDTSNPLSLSRWRLKPEMGIVAVHNPILNIDKFLNLHEILNAGHETSRQLYSQFSVYV